MAGNLLPNSNNRNRRRRSFRPSSDINVTPLVDVMLVLLIIFMVTAPMLTVGVPVDLPKTNAAQINDQVEPLVVSMDINGKTYFQENELSIEAIIEKLIQLTEGKPDTKIYVRGDKKIAYGQIMEVMGVIASAGFQRVSLIAELPNAPTQPVNTAQQRQAIPTHTSPIHTPPIHTPMATSKPRAR